MDFLFSAARSTFGELPEPLMATSHVPAAREILQLLHKYALVTDVVWRSP